VRDKVQPFHGAVGIWERQQMNKTVRGKKAGKAAGFCENSRGTVYFVFDSDREKLYEKIAARFGLRLVEFFYGSEPDGKGDYRSPMTGDGLLLIDDIGDCYLFEPGVSNRTRKITVSESVRYYRKRRMEVNESANAFQWCFGNAAHCQMSGHGGFLIQSP
jgi:hypothetical protein